MARNGQTSVLGNRYRQKFCKIPRIIPKMESSKIAALTSEDFVTGIYYEFSNFFRICNF